MMRRRFYTASNDYL